MKIFSSVPLLLVVAAATSVFAQAPGSDFVDDLFERDDIVGTEGGQLTARQYEDIQVRHAEEIFQAKRDLERLERRSRSVCYAGCATFTGPNKLNCWRKCDRIWGN